MIQLSSDNSSLLVLIPEHYTKNRHCQKGIKISPSNNRISKRGIKWIYDEKGWIRTDVGTALPDLDRETSESLLQPHIGEPWIKESSPPRGNWPERIRFHDQPRNYANWFKGIT